LNKVTGQLAAEAVRTNFHHSKLLSTKVMGRPPLALRDMLRRDATSVATGGIAEVIGQPPFERTTLVTLNGRSGSDNQTC
jgi:hypothetical protein